MIMLLSLRGLARRRGLAYGTVLRYRREGRLPSQDGELTDDPDGALPENEIHRYPGWIPETVDNWERPGQGARTDLRERQDENNAATPVVIMLLSLRGLARRRGLAYGTVLRYRREGRLPPQDGELTDDPGGVLPEDKIHRYPGWLPGTVDNWDRPGSGARTDLRERHRTSRPAPKTQP